MAELIISSFWCLLFFVAFQQAQADNRAVSKLKITTSIVESITCDHSSKQEILQALQNIIPQMQSIRLKKMVYTDEQKFTLNFVEKNVDAINGLLKNANKIESPIPIITASTTLLHAISEFITNEDAVKMTAVLLHYASLVPGFEEQVPWTNENDPNSKDPKTLLVEATNQIVDRIPEDYQTNSFIKRCMLEMTTKDVVRHLSRELFRIIVNAGQPLVSKMHHIAEGNTSDQPKDFPTEAYLTFLDVIIELLRLGEHDKWPLKYVSVKLPRELFVEININAEKFFAEITNIDVVFVHTTTVVIRILDNLVDVIPPAGYKEIAFSNSIRITGLIRDYITNVINIDQLRNFPYETAKQHLNLGWNLFDIRGGTFEPDNVHLAIHLVSVASVILTGYYGNYPSIADDMLQLRRIFLKGILTDEELKHIKETVRLAKRKGTELGNSQEINESDLIKLRKFAHMGAFFNGRVYDNIYDTIRDIERLYDSILFQLAANT